MKSENKMKSFSSSFATVSEQILSFFKKISTKMPVEINARNILIVSVLSLIAIGTVMITSASIPFAENKLGDPYSFLKKHAISLAIAGGLAFFVFKMGERRIFNSVPILLLVVMLSLGLVLLIGESVNGSQRWIGFGGFSFQVSEMAKVVLAIYIADFVVRRDDFVKASLISIIKVLGLPVLICLAAIMAQPDLGSTVVILFMLTAVLFISGAPIQHFVVMLGVLVVLILFFIAIEPYRIARATNFIDPFLDQYGEGYQGANSLMAYALGGWTGVGLGQSVQKLSYLPEAHTDFILAIIGEEFGLFGVVSVIVLQFVMLVSCMYIGYQALKREYLRAGYVTYAFSFILLSQIIVNVGMTLSILPVKGLTLPFVSYGGSSLMMCSVMIAMILCIDRKWRLNTDDVDEEVRTYKSQ